MVEYTQKDHYGIEDLREIVRLLRSPGGCPWDKEQDHQSIRNDFLEEAYEAVEAIDLLDMELMREELGDVLLQVVFHCVLAEEEKAFDFERSREPRTSSRTGMPSRKTPRGRRPTLIPWKVLPNRSLHSLVPRRSGNVLREPVWILTVQMQPLTACVQSVRSSRQPLPPEIRA